MAMKGSGDEGLASGRPETGGAVPATGGRPADPSVGIELGDDSVRILRVQRDLAIGLLSCGDSMECLRLLLDLALELPGFDGGGVYLADRTTGALRLVLHKGLSAEFIDRVTDYPGGSLHARIVASGEMRYAAVDDLPPEVADSIRAEGLRKCAILPIRSENTVFACLNVASRFWNRISTDLRMALENLIAQTEVALNLIRVREELEMRVAERTAELKAAYTILSEKSTRLELALDASEAGVSEWILGADVHHWDERVRRIYGFGADEEVTLEGFFERVHPDDRDRLLAEIASIEVPSPSNVRTHEFRIRHPQLGERWIGCRWRLQRDDGGKAVRTHGITFDITRRKLHDEALRISEEKYRRLYESMMDAFASVDLHGRIIEANQAFQGMLGYSLEELREMNFRDITHERWYAAEDEIVNSPEFFERGYSELYEKEYVRKDGSLLPVEIRAFLVKDGMGRPVAIWGIVRDVSRRKEAERELLEWNQELERRVSERAALLLQSEARYRQLSEATFEGIAVTENGILLDGNPQLAALHGYELEEMIGRPVIDFIAPESHEEVRRRIREGYEKSYESLSLRKDGSTFPVESRASMRDWHGRLIRVTAIRDLTLVKETIARLHRLQTELRHAQQLGLVSEVSAGIVHQIGQPLCSMGANMAAALGSLRRDGLETHHVMPILGDVERDIGRLRQITLRLRSLANPGRPAFSRFDPNAMLVDVLGLVAQEAVRRETRLESDLCRRLPDIEGDSVQLSQVLLILIYNAMDACAPHPPDGRVVSIGSFQPDDEHVEFRVVDSGTGIAPDVFPGLFAPFFTTKADGLGIGLRLSQTIIRAHGGSIEGGNRPEGSGAVFRVVLPVRFRGDYTEV